MILQIKFDNFHDHTDYDWDPENEFSSFSVALNTRRDDVMCRTLKVSLNYDKNSNYTNYLSGLLLNLLYDSNSFKTTIKEKKNILVAVRMMK